MQKEENAVILERSKLDILCEAFLFGSDEVKLYDKIDGKAINTIRNNYEEEIFYSIEIYGQNGLWFNIRAEAMGESFSGWIKNKSYLATYSRNYTDTLFVYLDANKKDTVCSIPDYFTSPMMIMECKKDWVKVEIKDKDNDLSCKGWVLQNMTCSSPYTTCP
ncbi:hypothetical protein [Mesonia hippocampi]|uniref:hypothetical protein n=1 Tax=Mesonia hippocampi TaxID=1628250 RepID=UPI003F9D8A42